MHAYKTPPAPDNQHPTMKAIAKAFEQDEWHAIIMEGLATLIYHFFAAAAVVISAQMAPNLTAARLTLISLAGEGVDRSKMV